MSVLTLAEQCTTILTNLVNDVNVSLNISTASSQTSYKTIISTITEELNSCLKKGHSNVSGGTDTKYNIFGYYTVVDQTTGSSSIVYYNSYTPSIYKMITTLNETVTAIENYLTSIFDDDGRLTGYAQKDMNYYTLSGLGSAFSTYDKYDADTDTFTDAPEYEKISEYFLSTIKKVHTADYLETYYNNDIKNLLNIMSKYKSLFMAGGYTDSYTDDNTESGSGGSVIHAETKFWEDYASQFKSDVHSIVDNCGVFKSNFTKLEEYIYNYISYGQAIMEKITALTNFISAYDTESELYSNKLAMYDNTGYSIISLYNTTVGASYQFYAEACVECSKAPRVVNETEDDVTQFISNVAYYKYLNSCGFYSWSESTEKSIRTIMKKYNLL